MTAPADDRASADDPFDRLVLDESFVRGAARTEASAAERAAAAQRSRAAHADLQNRRDQEVAAAQHAEVRSRRGRRRRGLVILTVLATLVVAGAALLRANPDVLGAPADSAAGAAFGDVMTPMAHPDNTPTPQRAPGDGPLGTPAATTGDGAFAFIAKGPDGEPAAYDPCRPIPVVVNGRTAPAGADALLDAALAEVSLRTGLQFVREGTSDEAPSEQREPFQPDRYGDRWAPLLVAWSDQAESNELGEHVVGTGGSARFDIDGHAVFVSGQVTLDGPVLATASDTETQAVLMHELGHVVGLDHVEDSTQLMFAESNGQVTFGNGDRTGLALLGQGACIARL